MSGPGIEPAEFESSPEAVLLAAKLSELLARRSVYEKDENRRRHPRRRLEGEAELRDAIAVTLAKLGADPRPPLMRALTSCLAYTLAEMMGQVWTSGYDTGYQVGRAEPEPTLRSAATAIFGPQPDPWPTVEAFVEFYREHLAPGRPRAATFMTAGEQ